MFFLKKKKNLSPVAYYIYENSRLGTEKLYSVLKETSSWQISNNTTFVVTSFIYHFFFYRMILLSKYDDPIIKPILKECLNEMISHITNKTVEANHLVDLCDEMFMNLDKIVKDSYECHDKDEKQELIQLQGKFFIANVEGIKPKEVYDSVAILAINLHFVSLLNNGDSFLLDIGKIPI